MQLSRFKSPNFIKFDYSILFATFGSNFELKNDLHKETSMLLGFGNYGLDPIKEVENIVFYTKPLNFDRILIKLSEL